MTYLQRYEMWVLNTPDDGRLRPKHVEWPCRNKTCTVLHQVGVSFDLYCDARKHKIKIYVYVSTPLPISWNQLFKFHISADASIMDTFYLFSNVLIIFISYLSTSVIYHNQVSRSRKANSIVICYD